MKRLMRYSLGWCCLVTFAPSPCHSLLLRQDSSDPALAHPLPAIKSAADKFTKKFEQAVATDKRVEEKPLQSVQQAAASGTGKKERPPRLHFLFLADDKISNWPIWKTFFEKAPPDHFRAFIHCKTAACLFFATETSSLKIVHTVPSTYCMDLVSPMHQLLDDAQNDDPESANQRDKFIYVSDSSLPSKSFHSMYNTLVKRKGSDICVYPSKDWADVPVSVGRKDMVMAMKAHQWMILERPQARKATASWRDGVWRNLPTFFKLNPASAWQKPTERTYGDTHNFGCLDEYWHMAAIFGPVVGVTKEGSNEVDYPGFTNNPLLISSKAGWQGTCDTFALWSDYKDVPMVQGGKQVTSNFKKLLDALDAASYPHTPSNTPAWWDKITAKGITAIKNSDFLFMRKFVDNPTLVGGGNFTAEYMKIVFGES